MSLSNAVIAVVVLIVVMMVRKAWKESQRNDGEKLVEELEAERLIRSARNQEEGSGWHPAAIQINREEDYHTHYIGDTKDGLQFFAYNTFYLEPTDGGFTDNWQKYRKEYAVLYLFNAAGDHIETKHWYAGTTDQIKDGMVSAKIEEMLLELGDISYGNIMVKPFSTEIDGITFGLIPYDEYETINLEPSSTISFHGPWNGEYDT
jgi:hypothetical protein